MVITSQVLEAYLKCPLKCWFQHSGEEGMGNIYSDWLRKRNEAYQTDGIERLLNGVSNNEFACAGDELQNVKTAKWKFAANFRARKEDLESSIDIVEQIPSEGRGKPAQFIPVRFISTNKLSKDDRLLLTYDAFVLSEMLRRDANYGKIIHGGCHTTVKVRTSPLMVTVRKLPAKITALLASNSPPELILNRHCTECEYQGQCRQKAIEKDDLSLLAGMTEKERKKLNSKGIFTITQLSYTFRPRRRPKLLRDKREKYHHSLKALAIREKKIHIVGSPELKIEGTPVYLDVEGLPDRDFYYLIGVRFRNGDSVEQHSLWADEPEDEGRIWSKFLTIVSSIDKPVLIFYGSYETTFIKSMCSRYSEQCNGEDAEKTLSSSINILSIIYGQFYFPVASNGLKEIAGYCGFRWSETLSSGLQSIVCREQWETSRDSLIHEKLIRYNTEDCEALELAVNTIQRLTREEGDQSQAPRLTNVTYVESLKPVGWPHIYGVTEYISPEFSYVNDCAYWDYQRSRIYIRSNPNLKKAIQKRKQKRLSFNAIVQPIRPSGCPVCNYSKFRDFGRYSKNSIDLKFFDGGIKRWITHYIVKGYKCKKCSATFTSTLPDKLKKHQRYGIQLQAYIIYNIIELHIPMLQLTKSLKKYFGIPMQQPAIGRMKNRAARFYQDTFESIKKTLLNSKFIHVDETHMSIRGKDSYVWVFTSMEEVVYIWSETREADVATSFLKDYNGILISDFYSAYDSISCVQQRCLIHLIRDLNADVLHEPFNDEMKGLALDFANLLKSIISTVDRFGLKHHFLKKHKNHVKAFYDRLFASNYKTELAQKTQMRFKKNYNRLFTFLDFDNVPWNNNNAEHAIKFFSSIRDTIGGRTNDNGIKHYLTLLSICETCKYRGLDFLDFLRSEEKDIDEFSANIHRKSDKKITIKPTIKPKKQIGLFDNFMPIHWNDFLFNSVISADDD
jgi:predicted RecB family nuclease